MRMAQQTSTTALGVRLDECLSLTAAPRRWPARADGSRPHRSTLWRYATVGIDGVVLRTVRVPGVGRMTHPSWIDQFIAAVNGLEGVA